MIKTFVKYLIIDKCIELLFSNIKNNFSKDIVRQYGLDRDSAMAIIKNNPNLVARYRGKHTKGVWWGYPAWKKFSLDCELSWKALGDNYCYWDINRKKDIRATT